MIKVFLSIFVLLGVLSLIFSKSTQQAFTALIQSYHKVARRVHENFMSVSRVLQILLGAVAVTLLLYGIFAFSRGVDEARLLEVFESGGFLMCHNVRVHHNDYLLLPKAKVFVGKTSKNKDSQILLESCVLQTQS